ncbi:hypothetical protein J4558_23390 [Leptolyngbya sp. 15MV]|nr:hypothetical protein J4558_23390 [Leptolyngbya sp. 15MV]
MKFRLTYSGPLLATQPNRDSARAWHKHAIRKTFHLQLKKLWATDPGLRSFAELGAKKPTDAWPTFSKAGFDWRPLACSKHHLHCELDILLLRPGEPGSALADIDNRLKTLFDALRMPQSAQELGRNQDGSEVLQAAEDQPFNVLLEDDKLISAVSVQTDRLLECISPEKTDTLSANNMVRLVISVYVRPYFVTFDNTSFL